LNSPAWEKERSKNTACPAVNGKGRLRSEVATDPFWCTAQTLTTAVECTEVRPPLLVAVTVTGWTSWPATAEINTGPLLLLLLLLAEATDAVMLTASATLHVSLTSDELNGPDHGPSDAPVDSGTKSTLHVQAENDVCAAAGVLALLPQLVHGSLLSDDFHVPSGHGTHVLPAEDGSKPGSHRQSDAEALPASLLAFAVHGRHVSPSPSL